MKTILVPTDFSDVAYNAISYAAEFAKLINGKVILFHAYHIPMLISEVPFLSAIDELPMEEDSNEQMKLIIENLYKIHGNNLDVEYLSAFGFAADEISNIVSEKKIDLIIIGTKGINNNISFFKNNTIQVLKRALTPILVIPQQTRFKKIDKIVFAFDYLNIKNESILNSLLAIASLFDSEIMILNVEKRKNVSMDKALEGIKIEHIFEKLKHSYWFSEEKNLVDAIEELSTKNHAVMICMIKRQHTFFQRVFYESNTELMTLYTHLPLLILHDQNE